MPAGTTPHDDKFSKTTTATINFKKDYKQQATITN